MATLKKPTGTRSKVGTAAPAASTPTVAPKRTTRAAAAAKATSTEPVAATSTRKQLKPKLNAAEPTQPIQTSRPVSNRSAGDAVEVIPQPKAGRQSSILSTVTDSAADRESLKVCRQVACLPLVCVRSHVRTCNAGVLAHPTQRCSRR